VKHLGFESKKLSKCILEFKANATSKDREWLKSTSLGSTSKQAHT